MTRFSQPGGHQECLLSFLRDEDRDDDVDGDGGDGGGDDECASPCQKI